jgi:DNA-binding LacI/PurR family transcriptional regulator
MTVYCILPSLQDEERIPAEQASRTLAALGYDTLIAVHHHDADTLSRLINRLSEGVADGALLIPGATGTSEEVMALLSNSSLPVIFLDRSIKGLQIPVVSSQNRKAAAQLVTTIAQQGVKHFLIDFKADNSVLSERLRGIRQVISAKKLTHWQDPSIGPMKEKTPAPIGVLANDQGSVMRLLESHSWLKKHPMVFGVFDRWNGEPHPASRAMVAIQDFTAMGSNAAELLATWMTTGTPPAKQRTLLPLKTLEVITPCWT